MSQEKNSLEFLFTTSYWARMGPIWTYSLNQIEQTDSLDRIKVLFEEVPTKNFKELSKRLQTLRFYIDYINDFLLVMEMSGLLVKSLTLYFEQFEILLELDMQRYSNQEKVSYVESVQKLFINLYNSTIQYIGLVKTKISYIDIKTFEKGTKDKCISSLCELESGAYELSKALKILISRINIDEGKKSLQIQLKEWVTNLDKYLIRKGAKENKRGAGKFCGAFKNKDDLYINDIAKIEYQDFIKSLQSLIEQKNKSPISAIKAFRVIHDCNVSKATYELGLVLKIGSDRQVSDSNDEEIFYPDLIRELEKTVQYL